MWKASWGVWREIPSSCLILFIHMPVCKIAMRKKSAVGIIYHWEPQYFTALYIAVALVHWICSVTKRNWNWLIWLSDAPFKETSLSQRCFFPPLHLNVSLDLFVWAGWDVMITCYPFIGMIYMSCFKLWWPSAHGMILNYGLALDHYFVCGLFFFD